MLDSRSRTLKAVLAAMVAASAFLFLYALAGVGGPSLDGFANDGVYTAIEFAAVGVCAARGLARRRQRRAWLAISAGLLAWSGGDLAWTLWLANLANPPYPSAADALYLAMYPALYTGFIILTRARFHQVEVALWLDGIVVGLATAAVGAAWVFPAVLHASKGAAPAAVATNLAYPLADFVLLVFLAVGFALSGWRPGRQWLLLSLGIAVSTVADMIYVYEVAKGTYVEGGVLDAMWPTAMVLLALAAWQPSPAKPAGRKRAVHTIVLPAVSASIALGLLVSASLGPLTPLAVALSAAALFAAGLRAAVTHRENVRMIELRTRDAYTDALTGLGNRRRLLEDLDAAFERALAGAPATLVFFDLDGFKRYNDSFGHGAGDALLRRLGAALGAAVEGHGAAYRLGGDEFCALLAGTVEADAPLLHAARSALSEHGSGFSVTSSCGVVSVPADAETVSEALNLADERMYLDKAVSERSSRARAQAALMQQSVLMQLFTEREPNLHEHVCDVGVLAMAVGQDFGLDSEQLDELRRAAELHDVGKLAVPDQILNKPGPLSEDEWRLMRQHTMIGERILNAAPALRPVARLIRSSHERWDGGGYPDGLAGDDIPLGSRIIAACDAYDAMVSERPYDAARPSSEALAELRRNAGSQFDARVIDALERHFAEHGPPDARAVRAARSSLARSPAPTPLQGPGQDSRGGAAALAARSSRRDPLRPRA